MINKLVASIKKTNAPIVVADDADADKNKALKAYALGALFHTF